MITKKERIECLINLIKQKYFDNVGLFKYNELKLFEIEKPIKKFNGYQCSYGYDQNGLGYYFIVITRNYEGFVWFRNSYKNETGNHETKDTVIATTKFLHVKEIFKAFNLNNFKDIFIDRIYERLSEKEKTKFSLNHILANISGYSITSITKREIKSKVLGMLVLWLLIKEPRQPFNKKISDKFIDNLKGSAKRSSVVFYVNDYLAYIIVEYIEYILKNNIDIENIDTTAILEKINQRIELNEQDS